MKRFIYLILAIVIILFVFEDKVRPYTDPVAEKAKIIWQDHLAEPYERARNFVSENKNFISEKLKSGPMEEPLN
jgi:hypothetical protein